VFDYGGLQEQPGPSRSPLQPNQIFIGPQGVRSRVSNSDANGPGLATPKRLGFALRIAGVFRIKPLKAAAIPSVR
jgi:hypothetical protein